MGTRYGPDDEAGRQRAVELREAGATIEAIKEELAVGSTRLARWLEGVPSPPRRPAGSDPSRWSERRRRAYELRLQGRSYLEIEQALGIPKSTQSGWFRDVPLSEEHRRRLEQKSEEGIRSRAIAIRAGRIRRTEVLQDAAAAEIGSISDRELFLIGVTLYWAEGSKTKPWAPSTQMSFINSDPQVITIFVRFLELVGVARDRLVYTVAIHESADVAAATAHWARVVGVDPASFRRPNIKRHNPKTKRRNTDLSYVGCLTIRVRRSVDLNRKIEGWWNGITAGV